MTELCLVGHARDLRSRALHGVLLLVLLVVVSAAYWPGLSGGFVFDDYPNIVFNTPLHVTRLDWRDWVAAAFSSPSSDMQRPLAMLSFAINHYFTGLNPWPMKLTNLALHLVNTGLVFGLLNALLRAARPDQPAGHRANLALFATACWVLLPINLMPVLLVVQRMEILSHAFVFAGLWLYVSGRLRQGAGMPGSAYIYSGLLLGTGLGALCKESAVLLPLYALCLEIFVFRFRRGDGSRDRRLLAMFVAILLIPAAAGIAWLLPKALDPAAYSHRNFDLAERLLTEPRIVLDYFRWTLAPQLGQLSLFHDDYPVSRSLWSPPATLVGWGGILLLGYAAWRARRVRPLLGLGLSWFLGAQLLTATFIPLELVFEHRNYFASLGLCLALADLLLLTRHSPALGRSLRFVAGGLLVFYAVATHFRALEWSNPLQFALSEAAKHPASPRATYQLAQTYSILSNGEKASPFTAAAFTAFEQARKVPGATIAPAQGALLLAVRTGRPLKREWWQDIQDRLRSRPVGPQELSALGALTGCATVGRCRFPPDEMLQTYGAALSQGDNPEVLSLYANYAVNVLRDPVLAERLWGEAHRLNPREPQYLISLIKLKIALDRVADARQDIDRLRTMGRLGQYDAVADQLEARLPKRY